MFRKLLLVLILTLASFITFAATEYRGLKCAYNDSGEIEQAVFTLHGNMTVEDNKTATLSYSAMIRYVSDSDYGNYFNNSIESNVVFGNEKDVRNIKYNGRVYKNHFKFPLEWTSVGGSIEYAELIISKAPDYVETDKYGAKIETFTGALNVSYNDHHGDTVWVKCTRRYFKR